MKIDHADIKFAKVDRMEHLFIRAFAEAFGINEDDASNAVGYYIMTPLEDRGITKELVKEYPVKEDDLKRLGLSV
ncbi:MAG: hypothetical protein MI807_04415 [Verrucomicrobiales bacterium]|nr:hypothetical protein [Verrucomicrobiales bacterium]